MIELMTTKKKTRIKIKMNLKENQTQVFEIAKWIAKEVEKAFC